MHKHLTEQLTRREREIMNVLFALGNRASAEEIRTKLTSPPSDSSVRVMLARLERKGYSSINRMAFVTFIRRRSRLRSPNERLCSNFCRPSLVDHRDR